MVVKQESYAIVRKEVDGSEFILSDEMSEDPVRAQEKAAQNNVACGLTWAHDNPPQRIVKVVIVETETVLTYKKGKIQ